MSKPQKYFTITMWIIAAVAGCSFITLRLIAAARQSAPGADATSDSAGPSAARVYDATEPLMVYGDAPQFVLTDQNGHEFTNAQLSGHIWVCDFFFTTCASLCPLMSKHMEDLQGQLPADVKLVSISVDPAHDTPPAMLKYANMYNAQPGRWTFLTGDLAKITAAVKGFKLYFSPATVDQPIQHDPHFIVVDGSSKIRGAYDSNVPAQLSNLVQDVQSLEKLGASTK